MMMMESELHRVASFSIWSGDTTVSLLTLARCGFWNTGKNNEVECFCCKTRFNANENPPEKHKERPQRCEFLRNAASNAPLKTPDCNYDLPRKNEIKGGSTVTDDSGIVVADEVRNEECKRKVQSSQLIGIYYAAIQRARKNGLFLNENECNIDRSRPDYDLLKIEANRLKTFYDWPTTTLVTAIDLAREGLFYTGSEDRVQCVFCKGVIRNWESTDVPSTEHRKHYPDCPFVRGLVGDIPNNTTESAFTDEGTNTTPVPQRRATSPEIRTENLVRENVSEQLALVPGDPSKFPEYSDFKIRVASFQKGVVGQGQTAEGLADAGWFYVGPGDKVKCFHCGGNLRDWEPEDNPWTEHKRWYEYCQFTKIHRPTPRSRAPETPSLMILASNCSYRIEPREVKARMDTPTVRAILDMGYSREMVRAVIETRLSTTGDDFTNAESLLEALFQMEELTGRSQTGATPSGSTSGAATSDVNYNSSSSASASSRSSGYSTASSSASVPLHQSESASMPPIRLSKESIASVQSKASSGSNQSVSLVPEAAMTTVPETLQLKAKGKKKKNKKKKQIAGTSSAIGEEDQTVEELPEEAQNDKDTPFVDGEHSLEEIPDEEAIKYVEENRQLREARTCKVCMDSEVNTVFLPCGHLVCCATCSPHLRNCPICRTFIRGTVKTFLS